MHTSSITKLIERVLPEVIDLRHDFHMHPELSFKEQVTAGKIREVLARCSNIEVSDPIIDTDVVAVLNADRKGRCLAFRSETDALPINEETEVPYKSTVPGIMHACGHDGHMAILLGTAMVLSEQADSLSGKVKFIFQPAEEHGGGGGVLCDRGVLESPKVDGVVALHGSPLQPVGKISIRSGTVMAANSTMTIIVRGQGTHGAYPHRGIDPIVVAAQMVNSLQTIVSRVIDPLEPAVVTIGHISAGSANNVIPNECTMTGTIRYLNASTKERICHGIRRIAENTSRAHGAEADVYIEDGYPVMINDTDLANLIENSARDLFGAEKVVANEPVSMGVEDFAYFAQRVPAAIFGIGLRPESTNTYPSLHNPSFDFNDNALPIGMRMFCEIAKRYLS